MEDKIIPLYYIVSVMTSLTARVYKLLIQIQKVIHSLYFGVEAEPY